MRNLYGWGCALMCILFAWSCKYDDADLWNSVDDLNGRIAALENASRQAQSDIEALQLLTQKMYAQVGVSSVVTNEDGSYTIRFTDGTTATISDGTDGITPPSLSVVEEDGIYYWVLISPDGTQSYLYDKEHRRIQANGREGRTPQIRIDPDSGEWEISTDEGKTWNSTGVKARGEDGDAYFSGVEIEDGYVIFTLKSGQELRLLLAADIELAFVAQGEQSFSFGEQRVLAMKISGIEKFSVSKPDGWRAQLTGEGLSVTAPVEENPWAEVSGTISVVGFAPSGQGAVAEIAVSAGLAMPDTFENLSAGGTANCYVVRAAGGYSLDATVMGNGAAGATVEGVTFADYRERLEPVSAKAVWMTEKTLVRSLSIENGQLKFVVPEPFRAGNALVAACDAAGEVIWSWHIWLVEEDLDAAVQTYENGIVLMDRNLGALSAIPGEFSALGLYYQWGRKDPFVGPDQIYKSSVSVSDANPCRQTLYDDAGNALNPYTDLRAVVATGDGSIGSIAYATAHPETFIGGKNASDWYDGEGTTAAQRNNALWGNPKGAWRKDVMNLRWEPRTVGSAERMYSETVYTRKENIPGYFTYTYTNKEDEKVSYVYASPAKAEYEQGVKTIYDPCPAGYRMPSSSMWEGFGGASATNESKFPDYFRTAWDATAWGRMFTLPGGAKAWWPAGGDLAAATNKFEGYNSGKYWTSDTAPKGSVLNEENTEVSSSPAKLYDGYYYYYAVGDMYDTKAAQPNFTASGFTNNAYYLPPLGTVDGETKPALTTGVQIGGQKPSGGAARAYGCNVRCMKE